LKRINSQAILVAIALCGTAATYSMVITPQIAQAKPAVDKSHEKLEQASTSCEKRAGDKTWNSAKILIKAPPKLVWESVHEERKNDPDLAYSKVLEQGVNECRLEQKFQLIPVFGTAVCEMHNSEVPGQRIDYKLLKSDRFKAMEGSWVLTPQNDGRYTMLELSTHLDLGVPVPAMIMNSVTSKKLARRVGNVKKMAEKHHAQVAGNTNNVVE
jgi:hypothetical protein